jgi:hypothetical protein
MKRYHPKTERFNTRFQNIVLFWGGWGHVICFKEFVRRNYRLRDKKLLRLLSSWV